MEFEEFVGLRLGELLRFAVVLVGEPERAARPVAEALRAARAHWPQVEVIDRPFGVVRVGVVRAYLGDDASVAVAEPAEEFAGLTHLQRAVLVLGAYAGQTPAEVAAAVRAGEDEVAAAHDSGLRTLGTAPSDDADDAERWLRDLLDDFADGVTPDTRTVNDALTADTTDAEAAPGTFRALFATREATDESAAPPPAVEEPEPTVTELAASLAEPEADAPTYPAVLAGRPARVALLVAIVVVAVLLGVLLGHRTNNQSDAAPRTTAAAPTPAVSTSTAVAAGQVYAPIDRTLPGGRLLGQFFGSGSRTVTNAVYAVAANREMLINAVCSGSGGAVVGTVTFARCTGTPTAAVVPARSIKSVTVRTDPDTTWRFVVVDSPPRTTEAALLFPPPAAFGRSSLTQQVARASGSGSSRLTLASGATQPRVAPLRVLMTCSGGDLALATADGQLASARIGTCYTGWTYEFDVQRAVLPGALTVTAPASASWAVAVIRG